MRRGIVLLLAAFITACTAITVKPMDSSLNARHVCIQDNPKVTISDFVPVLREGFARHGISTEVITNQKPECEFVLTYSARRSWDITTYLSEADLTLAKGGLQVASANYHLKGKGGLSLNKWRSTKLKMDPVIDELLGHYSLPPGALRPSISSQAEVVPTANECGEPKDVYAELIKLDDLREKGILTDAEFEVEKKKLLECN